jgi:hypothetical protein
MLMTCAGCANVPKTIARDLPPPPANLGEVDVPPIVAGQDTRVALADHRVALKIANRRLASWPKWYRGVRSGYKQKAATR